jgi:hypothetical protein
VQSHRASSWFQVSQSAFRKRRTGRINEYRHACGSRHQHTEQFQAFRRQLTTTEIYTRDVSARPSEAGDKTKPDGVFADEEDDGHRRGRRFGHKRRIGTSG